MPRTNLNLALKVGIFLILGWHHEIPLKGQEAIPAPAAVPNAFYPNPESPRRPKAITNWDVVPGSLDQLHAPLLRRDLKLTSAQSCATTTCHGGPIPSIADPQALRGSEYQLWKELDPHARSWRTICGEKSVGIMKRLGIVDSWNQIIDPQGFDNCLACHNTSLRFSETRVGVPIQEGVGCNACHGPANKWINRHYHHDWSTTLADTEGFVQTQDVYVRARMCASCHVGDKDRDMNHDIIAAGHPQLQFDMATFQHRQPKHWRDPRDQEPQVYEGQLWLAGQLAAADAALALLESRAVEAHSVSQWPELATFDCASCHHNLGLDNDRTLHADGHATLSAWNFAGLSWLLDFRDNTGSANQTDRDLRLVLQEVAEQVEAGIQTEPNGIARVAVKARTLLAQWYNGPCGLEERKRFSAKRLAELVVYIAPRSETYATWESATQIYLAAVASSASWPKDGDTTMQHLADEMRLGLAYPASMDISRMAKRRTQKGRPATRKELLTLGKELSALLAQNRRAPDSSAPSYTPSMTRRGFSGNPFHRPSEYHLMSREIAATLSKRPKYTPDGANLTTSTRSPLNLQDTSHRRQHTNYSDSHVFEFGREGHEN